MLDAVGSAGVDQRVFKIDIGDEWWSTRLYLIAALAERLTQVRRLLIVHMPSRPQEGGRKAQFIGLLSTGTVIAVLRRMHPQIAIFERWMQLHPQLPEDPAQAAAELLQAGWEPAFGGGRRSSPHKAHEAERREKMALTPERLRRWFGEAMLSQAVEITDLNRASVVDLIRLVDYPAEYVPVSGQRAKADEAQASFVIDVIDKVALNRRLAQSYLLELKERARIS